MGDLRIGFANDVDASGGYVVERYKNGKWRPVSRVYGSYADAEKDFNNRASRITRYEQLGDIELTYDDTYHTGTGWIESDDMPVGNDSDPDSFVGGTTEGRGFKEVFLPSHFDPVTLSELKDRMSNNIMAFLKSAAVQHPDPRVRSAIAQYFFYVGV